MRAAEERERKKREEEERIKGEEEELGASGVRGGGDGREKEWEGGGMCMRRNGWE